MTKPAMYVTRALPKKGFNLLSDKFEVEVWPEYAIPQKEVLLEKAESADALITLLNDKIDKGILNFATRLKIVAQMAAGFDNIDLQEATKKEIFVSNTPDVLNQTTADFTWILLMAVARRMIEADGYVRHGQRRVTWQPDTMTGRDFCGATIGIVGEGRIGQAIIQ